jgi:hypothetical protein
MKQLMSWNSAKAAAEPPTQHAACYMQTVVYQQWQADKPSRSSASELHSNKHAPQLQQQQQQQEPDVRPGAATACMHMCVCQHLVITPMICISPVIVVMTSCSTAHLDDKNVVCAAPTCITAHT